MLQDDRVMSILTGLVIVVAMATLAQKSDRLLDIFFGEEIAGIAPQNDSVTVVAGRPEIIDVLANDENVSPEDVGGVRILVSPSCGAAETADNGVLYISNDRCVGEQLFAYCVQRGDECTSASVTVSVVSSKPVIGAQGQVAGATQAPTRFGQTTPQARDDALITSIEAPAATGAQPNVTTETAGDLAGAAAGGQALGTAASQEQITVAANAPSQNGGVAAVARAYAPTTPQVAQLGRSPTFGADSDAGGALQGLSSDAEPAIRLGVAPSLFQPQAGAQGVFSAGGQAGSRTARLSVGDGALVALRSDPPDLSNIAPATPEPAAQEPVVVARAEPTDEGTDTKAQIQSDVVAAINRAPVAKPEPQVVPENKPIALGCGFAEIVSRRGPGANSVIRVISTCRAGEVITLSHAGLEFAAQLDNTGRAEVALPVMDADSGVVAIFADGGRAVTPLDFDDRAVDLALRVAVTWTTPVDLDLHVFEYAAGFGADGHVWQQNPRTFRDVRRAGGGFLSSFPALSAGGQSIEVYTFWANSRARPGFARIALDHASRGDTPAGDFCGSGALAAPDYQMVRAVSGSVTSRTQGRFAPAACGVALATEARYQNGAVKDLEIAGR